MWTIVRLAITASIVVILFLAGACGSGTQGGQFRSNPSTSFPPATVPLLNLSTDTFTNSSSQHATEVEPDSLTFGTTFISSFQVGRIFGGGGSRSTDGGTSWNNPVVVSQGVGLDKDWIICDTTHYGNCYMEWDDNENASADGGLSWSLRISPGGAPSRRGGQPH